MSIVALTVKNINSFPFLQYPHSRRKIFRIYHLRYRPLLINGFGLYLCSFLIKGVNKIMRKLNKVSLSPPYSADKLSLEWNISDAFTAADGELRLELRAVMLSESVPQSQVLILKHIISSIFVRESLTAQMPPVPSSCRPSLFFYHIWFQADFLKFRLQWQLLTYPLFY